jgi:lipopolysaccharide biosynthesis glycosyltransferase
MIITCAFDRRFCEHAGVMLASLFANGDIGNARVIVFGYELRGKDKRNIRASCGTQGDRLEFIDIAPSDPTLLWVNSFRPKISPALYARLLIPPILADERDRLLFLDCDMIVVSSLRPLFELALDGYVAAAVPDVASTHPARLGGFPFPEDAPYFNAGMMLIDLPTWRKRGLTQAVFDVFEREGKRLKYGEQDAQNIALAGQWKALGTEWNAHENVVDRLGGYEAARIIHFTGPQKPNSDQCTHPLRSVYLRYREQTPWRGRRLTSRNELHWARKRQHFVKLLKKLAFGAPPVPGRPPAM